MLTVSCYAVHSVVSRFLALWRWTQTVSEWLTFFLSMLCCQCTDGVQALSNSSARDSISYYKMLSNHSGFLEASNLNRRTLPYSDTEVQLRNHNQDTSQEELEISDVGATAVPSIYIEQACGDPRGQQLVLDFSPQAGDVEVELRNQVYDLDSSSMDVTSESEPGLVQARGDHKSHVQYRPSRYTHSSDSEVVIRTQYPECESDSTVSRGHDAVSIHNEDQEVTKIEQKQKELLSQPLSLPQLNVIQPKIATAIVDQNQDKDNPPKSNPLPVSEQIWEFQSCFSSPMAVLRRTDPQWKSLKTDKASVQNDSEVELKSHLYTFVTSSLEDLVLVQKEGGQRPLMMTLAPITRVPRAPETENNFPAIHNARHKERV